MLTELQKRKWTRLFEVYDMDGNGTVGQSDFEIIFKNLAKAKNLEANSPQYDQLHAKFMEDWKLLQKDADKNSDEKVDLEEWLEHGDRRINDPSMYQTNLDMVEQIFAMFDIDDNGFITIDEYKTIISSFKVTEQVATETFPKLDLNGDGHISKEEFVELVKQFHTSDDPEAPGNSFFGSY